jgi:hypothetical protein
VTLELELQADRLRRERLVQALGFVASLAGAVVMFWLFGSRDASGPIQTADGRVMKFQLSLWAWIRLNVYGIILLAIAIIALVKLVRTARELARVRRSLSDVPRATVVE